MDTRKTKAGIQLKAGDTIAVWWGCGRDTITRLVPYTGLLESEFKEGAQIAEFALSKTGMTIDNSAEFEILGAA